MAMTHHQLLHDRVLRAIVHTLKTLGVTQDDPNVMSYPTGVPDLEEHLDLLIRLAHDSGRWSRQQYLAAWRRQVCEDCPHQFPSEYCPTHQQALCVPILYAEQIADAVAKVVLEAQDA